MSPVQLHGSPPSGNRATNGLSVSSIHGGNDRILTNVRDAELVVARNDVDERCLCSFTHYLVDDDVRLALLVAIVDLDIYGAASK